MKLKGINKCDFNWHYTDGVMQGSSITLNHIIDNFIEKINDNIKNTGEVKRKYTKNLFIDGKHYNNHSIVKMKLKISLRHYPDRILFNQKFDVKEECTVEDIYNVIADIVEFYAYEMDTDANNIKVVVTKFEIEENKMMEGE